MPEPDVIVIASKGLDIRAVKAAESLAEHLLAQARRRTAAPQWRFAFEFGKPIRQLSVECVDYLQQRGHQVVAQGERDGVVAVVNVVDKPSASTIDEGPWSPGVGLPHELRAATSACGAWAIWPVRVLEETLLAPLVPGREDLHAMFHGEPWVPSPKKFASPFLAAAEAVKAMTMGLMEAQPIPRASHRDSSDSHWGAMNEFWINLQSPVIGSPPAKPIDCRAIADRVSRALIEVDGLLRRFAIHSARAVLGGMFAFLRDSRPQYGGQRDDWKERWAFDRWEWIDLWGFGENHKRHECRVPLLADATPEDLALHLALTGQDEAGIPLRTALAVLDEKFDFGQVPMRELRDLGQPTSGIPALPDGPIALREFFRIAHPRDSVGGGAQERTQGQVSDHELVVTVGRAETQTSAGWSPRDAAVRSWLGERTSKAGRSQTIGLTPDMSLVRDGGRLVWLSFEQAPADLCAAYPGLVQLVDLAPQVVKCLEHWRRTHGALTDFAARAKSWQAEVPASDPLVPRLAESIFAVVAPWPDPYHLRAAGDVARGWTRSQCFAHVRTYFERIAATPLDQEPPNLIATFLYLIEDKRVIGHAWPGQLVEEWHFKVRTQDHTWIAGSLLVAPADEDGQGTSSASEPLRFLRNSGGYLLLCGDLFCAIEERDRRVGF
jgi:hypothetical protein